MNARSQISRLKPVLAWLLTVWSMALVAQDVIENTNYHGPKTTIKYSTWGGANEVRYNLEICREFVEAHPEIRVLPAVYPWGQYWAKMQTQAASGLAPDVIALHAEGMGAWIARGALKPLDRLIKQSGLRLEDYYRVALDACMWEGKLYAFPIEMPVATLIYSTDRFEESGIPRNEWPKPDRPLAWEQFVSLVRRLTLRNADGTFAQYGMAGGWNWATVMFGLRGGRFFDRRINPSASIATNSPALARAMADVFSIQYADRVHVPSLVLASGSYQGDSLLLSDKFAISRVGPWALETLKQAGVRFGLSPMPREDHPVQQVGANALGIFVHSHHPKDAWDFIRFMAGKEIQPLFGRTLKGIPSLIAASGSLVSNDFGIKDCEAFLYDLTNASPCLVTDNSLLVRAVWKNVSLIESRLDNEYDRRLRGLARDGNGSIAPDEYTAFVTGMHAFVAKTIRANLPLVQEDADDAFALAARKSPRVVVRAVLPTILVAISLVFLVIYVRAVHGARSASSSFGRNAQWAGYVAISPWLIGFVCFTIGPMVTALFLSFTEWNMIRPPQWMGAQHYVDIIRDKHFLIGLRKTFSYACFVIPIGLLGGLFTAGLLTADIRGRDVFKAVFYFPALFTGASAAVLWLNMFNKEFGIINRFLSFIGIPAVNWLDQAHAFYTVVLMNFFWIGGAMIIYYAAMKQIPKTLYEAAEIDGAGMVRKFVSVTIPMLSPVILFLVVVATIGAFQIFTPALFFAESSATIGSPGDSLRFYSVNIYDAAFNNLRMGKACCWAIILFVIIFIVTMLQLKLSKRFVYTEQEA